MPKKPPKDNPKCPLCNNNQTIKWGNRKNNKRAPKRYLCKQCNHSFTLQPPLQTSKTYHLATILNTISNYNLGRPLRKITEKNKIPSSTIHNWTKNLNLPLHRLRKNIHSNPIKKHRFIHHRQPFLYQYHSLKLDFAKKFPTLITYLKQINTSLPKNIFENSERISSISRKPATLGEKTTGEEKSIRSGDFSFRSRALQTTVFEPLVVAGVKDKIKQNYATKLAEIALQIKNNNKERHDLIENFMLINDTATIATEIPIYLKDNEAKEITKNKITTNLTGHIDILQIRYHKIYILDYKPEPVNIKQTINQLKLYREALSQRTSIPTYKFKLAFFNDKGYYEVK